MNTTWATQHYEQPDNTWRCPGCGDDLDHAAVAWTKWEPNPNTVSGLTRWERVGITACCGHQLFEYDY